MALTLPGLIIISVLFLGLLFVFTPLLYGPYLRVLEDREALEAGIARDGNESPELEAMEQQIQQALSEARDAARSATAEARAKTVASANRLPPHPIAQHVVVVTRCFSRHASFCATSISGASKMLSRLAEAAIISIFTNLFMLFFLFSD